MKIILNKEIFHQIFFTFCVVIPFFNNNELSFLFWLIAIGFTLKKTYSIDFIRYLFYFIFIFILALIVGFFYEYKLYFIIRDIVYISKPILGLLIGYQFFSNKINNPFRFLLNAGIVMASIHLLLVLYGLIFQGARSVAEIRQYGGYFNDYEVYAFLILIFYKKFEINITKKQYRLFLVIMSLSTFFYLARTNFIQLIILYLAIKGYFTLNKKLLINGVYIVFGGMLLYTSIYYYNPRRSGNTVDEFLFKIKNAPKEAFSTKINTADWKDFNDNFRSYENIRTIEQIFYNQTYLIGEGIGSQVDLNRKIKLGDKELRHISILHNGYMTVLLKSGIFGILALILSMIYFIKKYSPVNEMEKNINNIFIGTGLFLIVSYWVFMGFYNPVDTKTLIIGFLFAYKNHIQKQKNNTI